jgi:hypothetical protein
VGGAEWQRAARHAPHTPGVDALRRGAGRGWAGIGARGGMRHLVEVEDEIELADVAKVLVEHLDEEVDGLEARELVVVDVHAEREKEPGVAPIHKLVRAPLHEVGELGLALRHYFVAFDLHACRGVRAEQGRRKHAARLGAGRGAGRGMRTWIACFSESSYGTYHFDRRVLPCRFCRRRNRICAEAHVRLAPPAAVQLTPRRKAGASKEAAELGVGRHTPPPRTVLTHACFSTSCVRIHVGPRG